MLGIGGNLRNQPHAPPPADKHMRAVSRIHGSSKKDDDGDANDSSKSKDPLVESIDKLTKEKHKRKRNDLVSKRKKFKADEQSDGSYRNLADVIVEGKSTLQHDQALNGVTFALIGSSGCGKSTVIRKVLIDQVFDKKACKARNEKKEFIIQIFTESAKSDAFQEMEADVLVDGKGLDEDNINFCYHMNEHYDKRYNFLIILDDVLNIQYKNLVRRMFLTMRNTNLSSIVSLQYPNLIPKSIRTSVYFTLLFHMNNDEAVELIVRGWLSSYLPGKTIRQKMQSYLQWTLGDDKEGHNFFLRDNLNHRVYKVDKDYICYELTLLTSVNVEKDKTTNPKRKSDIDPEEDLEDSYGFEKEE